MTPVPIQTVSIVIERLPMESRWASHRWELAGVLPDAGGEPRTVIDNDRLLQRLHPGFELGLYRDEAEGYYLNVSGGETSVFVTLRVDEASGEAYPFQATLSYNEAARWMDSNERVERAAAWPELAEWVSAWVEQNYRPEPKKRRKPRSFESKGPLRQEEG